MYRYRYINKQSQYNRTSYSLLLEDLEGVMPEVRIEKEFNRPGNEIDDNFLYEEARKDILIAQQNYSDWLALQPSDEDSSGDQ